MRRMPTMDGFDHILHWKLTHGSHPFPGKDQIVSGSGRRLLTILEYHPVAVLGQGLAPLSLLLPGGYSCRSSESISQSHVREDDVARACRGVEASAQRQLVDLARGQNEDTETSGQLEVC